LARCSPAQSRIFKKYPELIDRKVRVYIRSVKATRDGDRFVINCGWYPFYFGAAGGCYQLLECAADPEAASYVM